MKQVQTESPVQHKGSKISNPKKSFNSFIFGGISGVVCGIIYQPLEVLKINMIILPDDLFSNKLMRNSYYYR